MRRHAPPGTIIRILLSAIGALTISAVVGAAGARAEAGDGISATGATVDRVGWWHEKNVATETPAAIVTVPPPPGVPEGTLAVGAINGEADRITAIGILPDASPGDRVGASTLRIKEAEGAAANANTAASEIIACPITEFWVAVANGTWANRPKYDCDIAKAPGTRADDGTWTFDLRPIAEAWLDPAGTLVADGIVLVEEVESPAAFQAVFATEGEGALVVSFEVASGGSGDEPSAPDPFTDGSTSGDPGAVAAPAIGSGDLPVGGLPTPDVPTTATTELAAPPIVATPAASSPNVLGNLPGGLVVAVPAFVVLMGLLSFSLGPAGEPLATTRQGGVSRALATRPRTPSSPLTPQED